VQEREERKRERSCCCITLNLPEYLPSEPYDVYPLANAHGTQASSPSSLSLSLSLSYSPLHACLVSLVRFLSPFLSLSFLFSSHTRSPRAANPPISYARQHIPGVPRAFRDVPSAKRLAEFRWRFARVFRIAFFSLTFRRTRRGARGMYTGS